MTEHTSEPTPVEVPDKPFLTRLSNALWETALGISTRGVQPIDHPDAYHYATMSYGTIRRVLSFLEPGPSDVLVDIGCGKGRVLCTAARGPWREVVGVELTADFVELARRNAAKTRGRRSPISVHLGDAVDFDYRDGTMFCLFNPFGAKTLDAVLTKIEQDTRPRPVRIVYANPLHDDTFAAHPWFEQYEHWEAGTHSVEHAMSYYRSTR